MTAPLHRVYLSLGSNLGDRKGYLEQALARLNRLPQTRVTAASDILETPPWGKTDQPAFLNMAAVIETALTPEELRAAIHRIERKLGRQRVEHWGPRTIDIDILVYNGEERHTPLLTIPHPYLTQRRFVLEPLAELAPDLEVNGKTVREWLAQLDAPQE